MRRRDTRRSSTRARRSAFRRSLSMRQRGRRRGGVDELGARVQRGVVDDRRHPAPVVLDRRPRAPGSGLGQRDRPAGLVDERLAVGQPVGDRQRCGRPGSRPASRAPARSAPRAARAARGRSAHSTACTALEHRDASTTAAGTAKASSTRPSPGPERPRPDVVDRRRAPPTPCTPRHEQLGEQRPAARARPRAARRSAAAWSASSGDDPPQRAVGEHVERAPPRTPASRRAGSGGMCVPAAVGRAAVEAHEPRGTRPRRRAAAAGRSRRRSARRRATGGDDGSAPSTASGTLTTR